METKAKPGHQPTVGDGVIRIFDLVFSFTGVVLTLPIMVLVAALIWLEDHGSILFIQSRVGRGRRPFHILKFRTMFEDQDRFMGDVDHDSTKDLSEQRAKFQTTSEGDPRITRIGRLLRPIYLDELPQLFNVLKGDMSLVGPRPDVSVQEADYTPDEWVERHHLRPGLTGLAQIDTTIASMKERTERDIEWIRTRSVGLYFRILLATFAKVLKRNSL